MRGTATRTIDGSVRELAIGLHPAATPVVVSVDADGEVGVRAAFAPVGPGYHTFVGRLVQRLGAEQGLAWAEAPADDGPAALTDPARAADRPLRSTPTDVARQRADHARDARRRGAGTVHLGTPAGIRYRGRGRSRRASARATTRGWRQPSATLRLAIDVTPWWADATDARYLLNRALCLMWTEVRWRPPADDDERHVHEEVLRLLARAFPLDPSLDYPWRAWHELVRFRDVDDAMTRQVEARAQRSRPGRRSATGAGHPGPARGLGARGPG